VDQELTEESTIAGGVGVGPLQESVAALTPNHLRSGTWPESRVPVYGWCLRPWEWWAPPGKGVKEKSPPAIPGVSPRGSKEQNLGAQDP
jgi:hypothetical protein